MTGAPAIPLALSGELRNVSGVVALSPDPEKRARQLANLGKGWPAAQTKHGLEEEGPTPKPEPADPEPEPEAAADPGGLEVVDYGDKPKPKPEPKPKPRRQRKRKPAAGSKRDPEPEPEREPDEPSRGGGLLGDLAAGFLGG